MTPSLYAKDYAKGMETAKAKGVDIGNPDDLQDFSSSNYADPEAQALFETRAGIQNELGANEHFTGNGLTADLSDSPNTHGVVETFNYDTKPQTIGQMKENGSLVVLDAQPL